MPMFCVGCWYASGTGHVHDLPGFPFTVILSIYDILDLYSFIELKPNVRWKAVLIEGPCKVTSILLSTISEFQTKTHTAGTIQFLSASGSFCLWKFSLVVAHLCAMPYFYVHFEKPKSGKEYVMRNP